MVVGIILLALGAVSLAIFLFDKIRGYSIRETIIKACTSLIFVALGIYSFIHAKMPPFGVFAIIGLVFGLFGDIFLDLKYVSKERSRFYTYAGFVSFGIGHIFYITGMMIYLNQGHEWYSFVIPFALGLVGGLLVILLEKTLKLQYGEYKFICWLYGTLLFSMTATTGFLAISHRLTIPAFNMLFIGGILFAVSDLILSGTYFGEGKERPIDLATNGVTYYAAQFLIAFSLFFIL